ncbi:MAG: hypothetical protein ACREDM_06680 [Methylocella sp.]
MGQAENVARDIFTHGSGQWLGGVYIVKAAARKSKANVIVIRCSPNGTIGRRRFTGPEY